MKFSALSAFDTDTSSFNTLVSLFERRNINLTGSHFVPVYQKYCTCVSCCQIAPRVENYQNITILSRAVSVSTRVSNQEIENNKETWCGPIVCEQVIVVNLVFLVHLVAAAKHVGSHFK